MSAPVTDYIALITAEHNQKPNYIASVSASIQPLADGTALMDALVGDFDLDAAVGVQEDAVGVRVGRTRFLDVPLNVYFSFGIDGLGFGQGVWKGPFDAADGLARLGDEPYRILLRAKIVANSWDGTVAGAYLAWDTLFAGTSFSILVQDYGNETLAIALIGNQPDVITRALFTTGELDLKPAGYTLFHVIPSVYPAGSVLGITGTPLFGFGADNANVGGFGHGAWADFISSE